jgi:hypothetical protein
MKMMYEQLEVIEPGSFDGFPRYIEEDHRHNDVAMERLVERDFRTAADFFTPGNLPLLFRLKPGKLRQHQPVSDFTG